MPAPVSILGISAFYHDSAACLLVDGEIVAAAQEERFTRKKHDPGFPKEAVEYCLKTAGLRIEDVDYVAFYDKPILKFYRLLETYFSYAPTGFRSFSNALPVWLGEKLHMRRILTKGLGGKPKNRFVFPEHHESHAASAFYPSPYEHAAVVTMDGVGEWATTTIGQGRGREIELLREIRFPHSLGLLYSAFTYFCGFRVNSGEYKLMGLAPYGEPKYVDQIFNELIDLKADGSYRLNMEFFDYCAGFRMTNAKFAALFGREARKPESELEQVHMDYAASIQKVTEEVVLRTVRYAHELTGAKALVLAGGVALNCVGNGRILREGPFDDVWIQPAAGDAGGALGAAQFTWHQLLSKERVRPVPAPVVPPSGQNGFAQAFPLDDQSASQLGPSFTTAEVEAALDAKNLVYETCPDEATLATRTAELLASENVVGWFQGRMEFGPRALGCRSLLGDPRSPKMQSVMNLKIKFRESFRPFAPIVLRDKAHEWFEIDAGHESPYMLIVAPVRKDKRKAVDADATGLDKLHQIRSDIPAVTHVDWSARLQTVDRVRNARLTSLLEAFDRETGCPVLINTSFNVRGEPIVCTPDDAIRCFLGTDMDVLVLENCIVRRDAQKDLPTVDRDQYLSDFALD